MGIRITSAAEKDQPCYGMPMMKMNVLARRLHSLIGNLYLLKALKYFPRETMPRQICIFPIYPIKFMPRQRKPETSTTGTRVLIVSEGAPGKSSPSLSLSRPFVSLNTSASSSRSSRSGSNCSSSSIGIMGLACLRLFSLSGNNSSSNGSDNYHTYHSYEHHQASHPRYL